MVSPFDLFDYGANTSGTVILFHCFQECSKCPKIQRYTPKPTMRSNSPWSFVDVLTILVWLLQTASVSTAFSMTPKQSGDHLYGIPNSGWRSPQWNWGSAVGTGHDCAAICRRQYATRPQRQELIQHLLKPAIPVSERIPLNFEEVKLVLALAWQRGRWDGSDGGRPGGYGEVLEIMAQAERYEIGTDQECSIRLVKDMCLRFPSLKPAVEQEKAVDALLSECSVSSDDCDYDRLRRQCSGLVLSAMGFIERGL